MATFKGTPNDDTWTIIEPGRVTIDGLAGNDKVAFGIQPRSAFVITQALDGAVLVDSVSGASGGGLQATLYDIETLVFDSGRDVVSVDALFAGSTLAGTPGDDRFDATGGRQMIDGAAGIDTVVFARARVNYLLDHADAQWTAAATAGDAVTVMNEVERLEFADLRLALDLDGAAGRVAKTLGAVFDAASVADAAIVAIGLQYADSGLSAEALMQLALDARLGAGASHGAVVDLLYTNVVGIAPTDGERSAFVTLLDNGTYTPATLGLLAADHELNLAQIDFVGLQANGLAYG